jgi:hypothetical protein
VFTFHRKPGVVWHNSLAEDHVRQGVLHRKVSGGRRSWRGAWVLERLMSIYRTCRIRGLNFVEIVRDALRGKGYPAFSAVSLTTKLNAYRRAGSSGIHLWSVMTR